MISREQIVATGKNYLTHKSTAENAKNTRERHAQLMVAAINRSTLNDYLVILRANLHDADSRSYMATESVEATDRISKSGRAYEKYDAYCKRVHHIVELLDIVEIYLEGKEPKKPTTEEYIKVAYDGSLFFCQRFAMTKNGQPTDSDEPTGGYAKFDAPSVTKLVVALRESGKLQPVYVRHAGGFRKVG